MTEFFSPLDEQTADYRKAYRQEGFILDVTEQLWEAMDKAGQSKADLAKRLDCSKAHISNVLSGNRNMTLRTLSDIADALGCEVTVKIAPKAGAYHRLEGARVAYTGASLAVAPVQAANESWHRIPVAPLRVIR
jgi:transcriptional regulator with XRE-family HTH domain